jgi:hypothetical protein
MPKTTDYKHTGDGVQIHLPSGVHDVERGAIITVSAADAKALDGRPDFEQSDSAKHDPKEVS